MTHKHTISFLRKADVTHRLKVCRNTLRSMISDGMFPPSVPIGPRAVGFIEYEVEQTLDAMISGSSTAEIKALVRALVLKRKDKRGGC